MKKNRKIFTIIFSLIMCFTLLITLSSCKNEPITKKNIPIFTGISFQNELETSSSTSFFDFEDIDKIIDDDFDDDEEDDEDDDEEHHIKLNSVKGNSSYIILDFYNPDEYEILSFIMNDKKYQSYQFAEDSTSEKIKVKVEMPQESGIVNFTVTNVKYIDGDDIENCKMESNGSINVGVQYDNAPTAVTDLKVDYTNITISTTVVDTQDVILESKGSIKLYLFEGNTMVSAKPLVKGANNISFTDLKENTTYTYSIVASYDMFDGTGYKINVIGRDSFTTLDYINVVEELGKDFIKVSVNKNFADLVVDKIELIKNKEVVDTKTTAISEFKNLLSDNEYEVKVYYSYKANKYVTTKIYKTLDTKAPVVAITAESGKRNIIYNVNITDSDKTITSQKINLLKDGAIVSSSVELSGVFENLLSNNNYVIQLEYSYNLNDGKNDLKGYKEYALSTKEILPPTVSISCSIQDGVLLGKVNITDIDNVFSIKTVELYKGEEFSSSVNTIDFSFDVESNVAYKIVAKYEYDINDGNGVILRECVKNIVVNKNKPTVSIELTSQQNTAYFNLNIIDINNVGNVDNIKLYKNDVLVKKIPTTENDITGLLSNSKYKLVVEYRYDLNDGSGAKKIFAEKVFTTLKTMPQVNIDNVVVTTNSIKVVPAITDLDKAGSLSKVELYKNSELKTTKTTDYVFTDLLSNSSYELRCYYTYNLNNGEDVIVVTKQVTTLEVTIPSVDLVVISDKKSINYEVKTNAVDNVKVTKVELLKNGVAINNSVEKKGVFDNLLSGNKYYVKAVYTYNLNDGNGIVESNIEKQIETKPIAIPTITINYTQLQDIIVSGVIESAGEAKVIVNNIYLYQVDLLIDTVKNSKSFSFDVNPKTNYSIVVMYSYDVNDGKGLIDSKKEFTFNSTKPIPTANIKINSVTMQSVNYKFTFRDENHNGKINGIRLYRNTMFIKQLTEVDTEVTGLVSNTEYTFKVDYSFDLGDDKGTINKLYSLSFKTLKSEPSYNMSLSKEGTSITIKHSMNDVDGVATFKSVKLYRSSTSELVDTKNDINQTTFSELLNDNWYRVVVEFEYNLNNGAYTKEFSDSIYIDSLNNPSCSIDAFVDDNNISYNYNYIDTSNIVKAEDVKIYHNGEEIVFDKQNKKATNLLNNNKYTIMVILKCDYNDGRGVVETTYSRQVTTASLAVPELTADFYSTQTTIEPKYNVVDSRNILSIKDVSIYNGETLVETKTFVEGIVFDGLNQNTVYNFITKYSYNLNDGKGEQTAEIKSIFSTLAYDVKLLKSKVLNNSAPKTNEDIVIELEIENLSNVLITSVVVNGVTYPTTATDNNSYVKFTINSGNESGLRSYAIEGLKYILNEHELTQKVTKVAPINVEVFSRLNILKVSTLNGMNYYNTNDGFVFKIDNPSGYVIKNISTKNRYNNIYSYNVEQIDNNHFYAESDAYGNSVYVYKIEYINENNEIAIRNYSQKYCFDFTGITPDSQTSAVITQKITTPEEFMAMRNGVYVLENDLDFTGIKFVPFEFTGVFDGMGHTIKGINYTYETEQFSAESYLINVNNGKFQNVYIDAYTNITSAGSISGKLIDGSIINNVIISGGMKLNATNININDYVPMGQNLYLMDGFMINSTKITGENVVTQSTFNTEEFKREKLKWIFNPIEDKRFEGIDYSIIDNSYIIINGYSGTNGDVIIPETIEGKPVVAISDLAFENNTTITSLTMPNNIVYYGGSILKGCSNITTIRNIDLNHKYLGELFGRVEFAGSYKVIPGYNNGYYYIPQKLTTVSLSNKTKNIGTYAFNYCKSLTSITLKEGVIDIGYNAFELCENLEKIIIPNGIINIGDSAFYGCKSLKEITIPSSTERIGNSAFNECVKLTKVNITDLTAWLNINFDNQYSNPLFYGENLYLNSELVADVTIPQGDKVIKPYVFAGCKSLTNINMQNSNINAIGAKAFLNCANLISIDIASSITSIGDGAFQGCYALKRLDISDLKAWLNFDFSNSSTNPLYYAKNLYLNGELVTNLIIPKGETKIKPYIFSGCTSITNIDFGNSITIIGDGAFSSCFNLTNISIPDSVTEIGNKVFDSCYNITSVNIPSSVKKIGQKAFCNCSSLENITIPSSVTSIGQCAFSSCTNLKNISIPNTITCIEASTFSNCSSLTSINIPSSVTSIGASAFSRCRNLKNVTLNEGLLSINVEVFTECNSLLSINIPYTVKEIGYTIFLHSSNLTIYCERAETDIPSGWCSGWNCEMPVVYFGCTGEDVTYTFDTGLGTKVEPITSKGIIDLNEIAPPIRDGYVFIGWLDDVNGELIKDVNPSDNHMYYYSTTKNKLYAKWVTNEEYSKGNY